MKTDLFYFLVATDSGVPIVSLSLTDKQQLNVDPVLLSAFSVAMSQFVSEVTSAAESNIQFAQYSYEGIIELNEKGDHIFILIGNALFQYQPKFYSELFQFIDKTLLEGEWKHDIDKIKDVINALFSAEENNDVLIPLITDKEKAIKIAWSDTSRKVIEMIDGEKNIKELAVTLNLPEQIVYAIIKILESQGLLEIKFGMRNYIFFEKTAKAFLLRTKYPQDYEMLQQYFPKALEILEKMHWVMSIKNIYGLFNQWNTQEIDAELYYLLENGLIKTLTAEQHLVLLIWEYLTTLYETLNAKLKNNKSLKTKLSKFFPATNPFSSALFDNRFDLYAIRYIFEKLQEEQLSIQQIFSFVTPILDAIKDELTPINEDLPKEIISETIVRILEKYGFTLERFDLLNILCPEEYIV